MAEIPEEQSGWLREIDTEEVYGHAGLLDGAGSQRDLSAGGHTDAERVWHDIYERVLWTDDTERALFEFDPEEVPEFVVERLEAAIEESLFADFESVPSRAVNQIRRSLLDSLETRHGWSINSLTDNLQDAVAGLGRRKAERIARTETQALVNKAREEGYREQFDVDEERFDWVGPSDGRTTEACAWIKDQIPESGVALAELRDLVAEANDRFVDHDGREWTPHINCRHTFVRRV